MKIAIIGGGASGLMAAITAAKKGGEVTLFERQSRVGKKLLATGNGRCNLTNMLISPTNFHGGEPDFALPALRQFGVNDTLRFFRELGLIAADEPSGRVYPLSDQAGSVVDVLRFAAAEAGVDTKTDLEITKILRKKSGFSLCAGEESFPADRVIVCCGGMAGGKLGGSRSGYELLKALGHSTTKLYPALVQLKTDTSFVKALKGVRADAEVAVLAGGSVVSRSAGEVQFTEYGLSGPAIFEVSRYVSTTGGGLTVSLDLMRPLSAPELKKTIIQRIKTMPQLTNEDLLTGMLQNRLGRTVIRYAGYELKTPINTLNERDAEKIAAAVKSFSLPVVGVLGFEGAQVTAGGVKTAEFDPETLESLLVPGLYAAGELLDIDGDCGGYNLQWAWASGHLAGQTL